jgi:hypothetical protein
MITEERAYISVRSLAITRVPIYGEIAGIVGTITLKKTGNTLQRI